MSSSPVNPKLTLLAFFALTTTVSLIAQTPQPTVQESDRSYQFEKGEVERRQERERQYLHEHSDAAGHPRRDLWLKGILDFQHMKVMKTIPGARLGRLEAPNAPISVVGIEWAQIGPQPLRIDQEQNFQGAGPDSGEVTDIAIDPTGTTDQVIYIATNDGGIWKSTDAGAHWTAQTDSMPSNSMGAVALDPGNSSIVYAGTGNAFNNGFFKGIGIYRSTDGGTTWTRPAGNSTLSGLSINRIVLPASGVLLVGATGVGTGVNQIGGLFKSIDGGTSYGSNSPSFNNGLPIISGNITDIDLDTVTAGTVYVCVAGGGLRRSTNSGTTFGASLFDGNVPTGFRYLSFAQSKAPNNQTLYVNLELFPPPPPTLPPTVNARIFKSTNGGAIWAEKTNGSAQSTNDGGAQTNYDQTIGVDPQNANSVYIGFQELYASTDGGNNFANVSNTKIHWDHHALVFSPSTHTGGPPTPMWVGTDGGIHSSTDGGANFANLSERIATNLFRQIDIGRGTTTNRVYTYGGCQDTGVVEHRPGFANADWHLARDGDGWLTVVDPGNPQRAYSSDDGIFVKTTDGGTTWPFAVASASGLPSCGTAQPPQGCAAPVAVDPNNSAIVYVMSDNGTPAYSNGTQLFKSADTGATFTLIHTFPAAIQAVSMVGADSNTMWVGLANGTVQRTSNLLAGTGSSWTPHTVTGAPAGQGVAGPQGIIVNPANTNEVIVVYPGFSGINPANRTKHVFRTTDPNGSTWTDISGTDGGNPATNLPDLPLHAVVIDPSTSPYSIMVGSDAGVARSEDLGATWQVVGVGLPTVDCTSLAIDATAIPPLLRVGTYGRSSFELDYNRVYVDYRNTPGPGDGTQENPFLRLINGINSTLTGRVTVINIQTGTYVEAPLSVTKPAILNPLNGPVTIR
jgi:photosystem II stability/assembly factor-like uncharacterized protein